MSKKERHKQDLIGLLETFLETGDAKRLTSYLTSNSNLPGPRGNLELAAAFSDLVEDYARGASERLWELCAGLTAIPAAKAPVNDPKEFLPFCGAVGSGAIGAVAPAFFAPALMALRALANDPRWRMREGVAMGLQRLLARRGPETLQTLEAWVAGENWLEMRAAVAGVAEPALLKDAKTTARVLQLHREVIACVRAAQARKGKDFRTLRKALGYTLSVVVRATPEQGFEFMRQLVDLQDPDVRWIVKENLKKNRLVKNFPEQVESVKSLLARG
jgi:hypothetical protein